MSNTKTSDKISKKDILSCKYIKNAVVANGKITFEIQGISWNVEDRKAVADLLEVSCPDIEMVSMKSFSPIHHRDIPVGFWIQSLINRDGTKTPKEEEDEEPYYVTLLKQSIEDLNKELGEQESVESVRLNFLDWSLKVAKQFKR